MLGLTSKAVRQSQSLYIAYVLDEDTPLAAECNFLFECNEFNSYASPPLTFSLGKEEDKSTVVWCSGEIDIVCLGHLSFLQTLIFQGKKCIVYLLGTVV